MPDQIVGVAVLVDMSSKHDIGKLYFLYITEKKDNGEVSFTHIPCYEDGGVRPEGLEHIWRFKRVGTELHCYPSVDDKGNGFHNTYNWSIPYVEWEEFQDSKIQKMGMDIAQHCWRQLSLHPPGLENLLKMFFTDKQIKPVGLAEKF